jgi:uncharacterized membrane protein YbhN (UPF0104 family)
VSEAGQPRRGSHLSVLRMVGTLLAVALLVYLLSKQGWDEIAGAFRQIAVWRILLAFALTFISRMAVSGRWYVLLRSGKADISFGQSTRITFAGLFASNFLWTTIGGDVVRLAGAIRFKFDPAVSAASLVVDRLVGMAGMAMALPFALPSFFSGTSLSTLHSSPVSTASPALYAGLIIPFARSLWEKAGQFIRRLLQALGLWLSQPRALISALGCTWVHMLCVFGSVWLLLSGMGESISFWLIAGLWSATYFVTLLPISINGLGVQELIMAFLFTKFGGISGTDSLTLALLMRVLPLFASLPGALFIPEMVSGTGQRKAS